MSDMTDSHDTAADFLAERRWAFRLRPIHRKELFFGFLLRVVIGLFAVIVPSIVLMIFGPLLDWQLTDTVLWIFSAYICLTVLIGEHIRSRIYERSVIIVTTGPTEERIPAVPLPKVDERERAPLSVIERLAKRCFDIVVAALGLIVLSAPLLIIAIVIKFDSRGPVLFRQTRHGFNGRSFHIYKFRTMRVMEEGLLKRALEFDARVTRIGRYLRRTSVDELPQLFNVLAGDMSIVGPRPHAIAHDSYYNGLIADYSFRHHVKPGITGWAQVNGFRGETPTLDLMEKRVEYDRWYINNWSFWLDLKIVLRTFVSIFASRNAY
jgi:exopolysaccharide biosynthesis polyprenyl glycosylphosphotransferase